MKKKQKQKKMKTMDIILIIDAIVLIAFSIVMINIYKIYGSIPDTLCTCVFAAGGGEFGIMGWIRTTKERHREREYEIEDRDHQEKKEKEDNNGTDRNNQRTEDLELLEEQGTE